jgi:hypothetical protein
MFTPRKVLQFYIDDKLKSEHESINAALRSIGKPTTQAAAIIRVCKGKQKTAFGYKWKYKED